MAKKGIIRRFFGSLLNVRKWANYDEVAYNAHFLWSSFRELCRKPSKNIVKAGSFDEAVRVLQLSEEDIKKRTKYFLYYFFVYITSAIALSAYLIYLLNKGVPLLSVLIMLVLIVLMLVYAFREHFWYMQMKRRKIGCGFGDWLAFIFHRHT